MKHKLFRIAVALILVVVLIVSWSPIRARAMAGGGVIGGTSAAGLALSPGMVGLLLLAAFGVYYMVDNADAIGRSLETVLDAAATNIELSLAAQAEYAAALSSWWESAKAGAIDLASAPTWIVDAVKDWASGFVLGDSYISGPAYDLSGNALVEWGSAMCAGEVVSVGKLAPNYTDSSFTVNNTDYILYRAYTLSQSSVAYDGMLFYIIIASGDIQFDVTVTGSAKLTQYSKKYLVAVGDQLYSWANISFAFTKGSVTSEWKAATQGAYVLRDATKDIPLQFSPYGKFQEQILGGTIVAPEAAVSSKYPDVVTGGIAEEIEKGTDMDVIGLPNIVIPGPDVLPVSPSEGQTDADAITDYLMAALIAGEITWEQYWDLIGVYNPAIGTDVPTVGVVDTETGTIVDTEIGTGTVVTPAPISDYSVDLTSFFPFCLPFDIYAFFELLAAEPETPHLEFDIELPFMLEPWHVVIDLSAWDSTALLARRLELLAFIIGLCVFTREKFLRS